MNYKILGMMSGTSLDGLDLAFCDFTFTDNKWKFQIIQAETIPYSAEWSKKLREAMELNVPDLSVLHNQYGKYIANAVNDFCHKYQCQPELISSHGHTIYHQPDKGITLQIGSGYHIAKITEKPVMCDYRSIDIAHGGQGAPLVPIGDQLLFSNFEACLNLGGFSNISFESNSRRIAYDIGPANLLLNFLSNQAGKEYDKDGIMAKSGCIDQELLERLNQLPYYQKLFPKSLGREWLDQILIPIVKENQSSTLDKLRTCTEHIALIVANELNQYIKNSSSVLITGGGANNLFLIERMQQNLKGQIELIVPEKKLIDFKEALIFAFLGVLKLRNENNILSSVTGASKDTMGGLLFLP